MSEDELINKLKSTNPSDIIDALEKISQRKNMRDISVTIALIKSQNPPIKKAAIESTVSLIKSSILEKYREIDSKSLEKLAQIIDTINPKIVEELVKDVHSPVEELRIHSIMILGLLRRRSEIRLILETQLKSNNEKIRATAIQALGHYPEDGGIPLLMKKLSDQDFRVRANAIEALEQFGDRKLLFSLKRLVNDNNNRVRANAIKALYNLGEKNIENHILHMLQDRDISMIASGCWLISETGVYTREIIDICKILQTNADPIVQKNAEKALRNIQ